jgi:hypothetical protein
LVTGRATDRLYLSQTPATLLAERGADLSLRVKLPWHYQRPGKGVECTPTGYAMLFSGKDNKAVAMLRARKAAE